MGRPKSAPASRNVKISDRAYEAARAAAGLSGQSIVDFVSRIIEEHAERIIDEKYEVRRAGEKKRPLKIDKA